MKEKSSEKQGRQRTELLLPLLIFSGVTRSVSTQAAPVEAEAEQTKVLSCCVHGQLLERFPGQSQISVQILRCQGLLQDGVWGLGGFHPSFPTFTGFGSEGGFLSWNVLIPSSSQVLGMLLDPEPRMKLHEIPWPEIWQGLLQSLFSPG